MRSLCAVLLLAGCSWAQCPQDAVFLGLRTGIRGFPLRANGNTAPCQAIPIQNGLTTSRSLAISRYGWLHTIEFTSAEMVETFGPAANGPVEPILSERLIDNDSVGLAVDARGNTFVATFRGQARISVLSRYAPLRDGFPPPLTSLRSLCTVGGLAIDTDDNLVVIGVPIAGTGTPSCSTIPKPAQLMTFATSQTLNDPPVLRTIAGNGTGLMGPVGIAIDPTSGELYVYDSDSQSVQVSVFAPRANGNVAPIRKIAGLQTQLPVPEAIPSTNKIAVSSDGRLFVAAPNNRILVFAPGASGDVAPSQIIQDSAADAVGSSQGSIAVRSCKCQQEPFRARPR